MRTLLLQRFQVGFAEHMVEGLFTDDNRLALAYVYYSYDESTQVYSYNARVITESGHHINHHSG